MMRLWNRNMTVDGGHELRERKTGTYKNPLSLTDTWSKTASLLLYLTKEKKLNSGVNAPL